MENQEPMAYLAVFGGIALFTVVLTVVAVRVRRPRGAESLAMRTTQVAAQCKDLLVGPDFLWAVWQDAANAAAMTMLVRNACDEAVSTMKRCRPDAVRADRRKNARGSPLRLRDRGPVMGQ